MQLYIPHNPAQWDMQQLLQAKNWIPGGCPLQPEDGSWSRGQKYCRLKKIIIFCSGSKKHPNCHKQSRAVWVHFWSSSPLWSLLVQLGIRGLSRFPGRSEADQKMTGEIKFYFPFRFQKHHVRQKQSDFGRLASSH